MNNYFDDIVKSTALPLAALQNHKVFVAGCGFYGKWFVDILDYCGVNVEYGSRTLNSWNILDVRTYTKFQREADYIINCAGRSDVYGDNIVLGDGPLALYLNKKPSATFLQISSGIVGRNGNSPYAISKQKAETDLKNKTNVQIVRPFATVGPYMGLDKSFAISTFICNHLNGKALEVAPGIKRSFCHITDLIIQILHVLVLGDGKPYEVGSDDCIDLMDAANLISKDIKITNNHFAANATPNYSADLTRIKEQFGTKLKYTSLEAVRDTLIWHII